MPSYEQILPGDIISLSELSGTFSLTNVLDADTPGLIVKETNVNAVLDTLALTGAPVPNSDNTAYLFTKGVDVFVLAQAPDGSVIILQLATGVTAANLSSFEVVSATGGGYTLDYTTTGGSTTYVIQFNGTTNQVVVISGNANDAKWCQVLTSPFNDALFILNKNEGRLYRFDNISTKFGQTLDQSDADWCKTVGPDADHLDFAEGNNCEILIFDKNNKQIYPAHLCSRRNKARFFFDDPCD